ncbi:MAG TPA: hypothetical protein VKT70_07915, partial [Stellaceae bacterium]|nr:hypothetical protein [Stellaceae bacterium]
FRDTAHGFLAWAVATVIGAVILAAATAMVVSGGIRAAGTAVSSAAQGAYAVDTLFRSDKPDPSQASGEAAHILAQASATGDIPAADRNYLAGLIAARTGLSVEEARKRVDDTITKTRQEADTVRKGGAAYAIFTALSMVIGAFIACVAAALGGRERDQYP